MSRIRYKKLEQLSFADVEVYSVLPEHPVWSQVEKIIDFSFADDICAHLYSPNGQRPYAPSLKLKLHIVQRYYDLADRAMEEKLIGDLFIKRFLGLPVTFMGLDHSTIALDRDRMGSDLFHACHHHILAQAKAAGLWGDNQDVWLVDSFPTRAGVAKLSTFRLIKHAVVRIVNQLKRANRPLYLQLLKDLDLTPLTTKLPSDASEEERRLAFSRLVVLAYGLLYWFESEAVRPFFWAWPNARQQLSSLERQAILYQILTETTARQGGDDTSSSYRKLSKEERAGDRIMSAVDPDVRHGIKSKTVNIFGDKVQVVKSHNSSFVLNAEPIAGNEDDGLRLMELVTDVTKRHAVLPEAVSADTAYGYGRNRKTMEDMKVTLSAPLGRVDSNPKGLFTKDRFVYEQEKRTMTCPGGHTTEKTVRLEKQEGVQFCFPGKVCRSCALQEQCTTSKAGRTVFVSDYYEQFERAKILNGSDYGIALQNKRSSVERTNNELKNHHGLGNSRVRSREKRRIYTKIVSMVVNLKLWAKKPGISFTPSFTRKKRLSLTQGYVCP